MPKEATTVMNNTSKEGGRISRKSAVGGGGLTGIRRSSRVRSNRDTSGKTYGRPQRRRRARGGNNMPKESTIVINNISKEGERTSRKSAGGGGGQTGIRRSSRERSNRDTSGKTYGRPQRRRRRKNRQNQEENKPLKNGMKVLGRRKPDPKKRKSKRGKPDTRDKMDISGCVSPLPLSTNSSGSQPGSSNFVDGSNVSPMEYANLPWANLDLPMDLSLCELEINENGVDFDLEARENHKRWLANLQRARE